MTVTPISTDPEAPPGRTALTDVRVFDGDRLSEPRTVVIDGAVIGTDPAGAQVIDAGGMFLVPGLIDAHVHLHDRSTLDLLCSYGVTTAFDMATWPPARLHSLRGVSGVTDILSAGTPAIGGGGPHARVPGMAADALVADPEQAGSFVAARVADGSDYIKVVLEAPGRGGPEQATVNALVVAAHTHGKKVVAHTAVTGAVAMALEAGVDVLTHVPLDQPLGEDAVARIAREGRVVIPTLTMMEGTAAAVPAASYEAAAQSVSALHLAGVLLLAGTDANIQPGVPFSPVHGQSLHHELGLLVAAGLSPVEALRSATSLPAQVFGLADRGAVEPGLRADLLLIDGNPLEDIRATRSIRRVWCAGVAHEPPEAASDLRS